MKGYIRRRGCTCKSKKCTCGAKWSYTIDVGTDPKTGKRKQKTKGGYDTKADAEKALAAIQYEINNGLYIEESNVLFKDFALDWLKIYEKTHNVKISTVRVRHHEVNNLMPFFAHLKVKDVSRKQYQDALSSLKDQGFADNTLEGIHATGRMIFKKAIEYDLIKKDPTEFAKIPRTQKTVEELEKEDAIPKYLEKDELALFLNTIKENGLLLDQEIFTVLAYTGMRVGELCALKWKDIDFKEKTISITKTYYNPTNNSVKFQLLTPKTMKSKRIIEVDQVVIDMLEKYKTRQNIVRMRLRDTYFDEDFVFTQTNRHPGYPIYIKLVEGRMTRILKIAKLDQNLTPHSLRHTHASLMSEAGAGLPEIMDRLGHSDDETTTRIYLHVTKAKRKETSQKFSELMRGL